MIALLRGRVERVQGESLILMVGDVGYRVFVPAAAAQRITPGATTELYIHTHVREDAILLYGFSTPFEQEVFETLLEVTGVGPRLGLAILSAMTPQEVIAAIAGGDVKRLTRVPGVGKKTAERLILELRDRFRNRDAVQAGEVPGDVRGAAPATSGPAADAFAALLGLGYSAAEAEAAVGRAAVEAGREADAEAILRAALRLLQPDAGKRAR